MKKNQRKVLLINRPFQFSFLTYTMGIAGVITLIYFIAIRYFFWKFESEGKAIGLSMTHPFFVFLGEQRSTLDLIFFITSVVAIIILLLYGLLISNRIAGPLYNLTQYLNNLTSDGPTSEIKFREKDYFREIAEAVNLCFKRLGRK